MQNFSDIQNSIKTYKILAKQERLVLSEAIKNENVSKQRRILEDYDILISKNIKTILEEDLHDNWELFCHHTNLKEFAQDVSNKLNDSDIFLNEKVGEEAMNFLTGGLKTQAEYLNSVEDYLTQAINAVDSSGGEFPILRSGLEKAKTELQASEAELEQLFQKGSGKQGFFGKLSTIPQRFLSRLGAGSTKQYQVVESLVADSVIQRKGCIGLAMSLLPETAIKQTLTENKILLESKNLLVEGTDPVSIASGMSSMGQLVGEIGKLAADSGGRLLTRADINSLASAHPDISRTTLENIVHIMGKNAQNVAGDPSQITPDLFQAVGRAMGWLPNNAASIPAPSIPGVGPSIPGIGPSIPSVSPPSIPGVGPSIPGGGPPSIPGGDTVVTGGGDGGSFLDWLYKLWIKAMKFAKGVYAKMYAYLAPKLIAIKAWLISTFKGGVAAAKGLMAKAGSWLASKGGISGLAGKAFAGLKSGLLGLKAAATSPAAAGLAAVGGAAAAGKGLYSLMSRRKNLGKIASFVGALQNIGNMKIIPESYLKDTEMLYELFGFGKDKKSDKPDSKLMNAIRMFSRDLKPFISDIVGLEEELGTEQGRELLSKLAKLTPPMRMQTS